MPRIQPCIYQKFKKIIVLAANVLDSCLMSLDRAGFWVLALFATWPCSALPERQPDGLGQVWEGTGPWLMDMQRGPQESLGDVVC